VLRKDFVRVLLSEVQQHTAVLVRRGESLVAHGERDHAAADAFLGGLGERERCLAKLGEGRHESTLA
jgi:hypothetical protein